MDPKIYKPSIYKGAGIYKAGAAGGGGGGGGDWAKNTNWQMATGTKYNGADKYIGYLFDSAGQGCLVCRTLFNLNNFNEKLEFSCRFFLDKNGTNPSVYARVISNLKVSGNRFIITYIYRNTGNVEFRLPNNQIISSITINADLEHTIKYDVERIDSSTANYTIKIDNVVVYGPNAFTTNISLYPTFFSDDEVTPTSGNIGPQMCPNDKLFLEGTYLKIDDEIIFGQE